MDFKNLKDYQTIVLGGIIGLSIILSTLIFSAGVTKYQKLQNQTINVTGSASKEITSDFGVLSIGYSSQANNLQEGYKKMNSDKDKIIKFMKDNNIEEKNISFNQISSYEVYKRFGSYTSNEIDFYKLNADVKISNNSTDVIDTLSKKIGELINEGVQVTYTNVEYFATDLDKYKVEMVGEATKNAKERAKSMVSSTGGKIGALTSAKTGVFQIVPVNSTEVSDMGINDTTSIKKKIVAVVNATFSVK